MCLLHCVVAASQEKCIGPSSPFITDQFKDLSLNADCYFNSVTKVPLKLPLCLFVSSVWIHACNSAQGFWTVQLPTTVNNKVGPACFSFCSLFKCFDKGPDLKRVSIKNGNLYRRRRRTSLLFYQHFSYVILPEHCFQS